MSEIYEGDHWLSGARVRRLGWSKREVKFKEWEAHVAERDRAKKLQMTGHACRRRGNEMVPGAAVVCPWKCDEELAPAAPAGEARGEEGGDKTKKDAKA